MWDNVGSPGYACWAAQPEPKQLGSTPMGLRFKHNLHPPSLSHVSGLFQSLSTPNNKNLEKASSYIPPMQL